MSLVCLVVVGGLLVFVTVVCASAVGLRWWFAVVWSVVCFVGCAAMLWSMVSVLVFIDACDLWFVVVLRVVAVCGASGTCGACGGVFVVSDGGRFGS